MAKHYWEKTDSNKCPSTSIIANNGNNGAIIVGRQLSDGLNEQERIKLASIATDAQANTIEAIEVNSEKQFIDENKTVNIFVPTKMSQLENDSNYINKITPEQIKTAVGGEIPFTSDFYITEDQWATLIWDDTISTPEIPSEEPETDKEDN